MMRAASRIPKFGMRDDRETKELAGAHLLTLVNIGGVDGTS